MRFPYSYFLRSSLLLGHFFEVEFLFSCGVVMGIVRSSMIWPERRFLDCQFIQTAQESILRALWIKWRVSILDQGGSTLYACCLLFASAVEKRKYGVDFCCIFICRPDWWWSSFFRVGGLFLSFLHCSHISGGYLSFFFSCHLSRSCWCLHAGFVDRRFLVIFFSIYHLRRKGGRLISFTISFRFTRGVHVLLLFFTYLISNLGGCLINYLSVVFWFYVVNAFLFLLLFFALHSPSYFYLIWCVFQVMWVYEVLV